MWKNLKSLKNRSIKMLLFFSLLMLVALTMSLAQAADAFKPKGYIQKDIKPLIARPAVKAKVNAQQSRVRNKAVGQVKLPSINIPANQAAAKAKGIGEAEARMKQLRELERIRKLGSLQDLPRVGGNVGRPQDCPPGSNPVACVQNGIKVGQKPNLANGDKQRAMQACLQAGGSVASCQQKGGQSDFGGLTAGPGRAPGAKYIPGRGQAQQNPVTDQEVDIHGVVVHSTTIYHDAQGRVSGKDEIVRTRVGDNTYAEDRYHTDANGHETSEPRRMYHVVPHSRRSGGVISNQAAPDSASGGRPDDCNWSPTYKKCMNKRSSGLGIVSQPGADGENPGAIPGSATPRLGSDAVTNSGDGAWGVNRSGGGHGQPLDMKEGGTKVPGGGFVPPPK